MKKSDKFKLIIFVIAALLVLNQAVFLLVPIDSARAQQRINLNIDIKQPSSGASVSGNTEVRVQIEIDSTVVEVDEVTLVWLGSGMGQAIMSYQSSTLEYYYNWDTTAFSDGQYYLEAIARHNGQYYYSSQITITVENNTAEIPQITIINPLDSETVSGQQTVKAEVISGYTIKGVYLHWPGSGMGHRTMSYLSGNLYTYDWDTTQWANNSYEMTAYVEYGYPVQTEDSSPITITVNNNTIQDLDVVITSPVNNAYVSNTVTIQAETNMEADSVSFEIFDEQNNQLTNYPANMNDNVYSYDWDTTTLVNGSYKIKAYAYYNEQTKHDLIYVSVNNGALPPEEETATTTPGLYIGFTDYPIQITSSTLFSVQANTEVDDVNFHLTGPTNYDYSATYAGSNKYYFTWDTTNFSSGLYQIKAVAQKGGQYAYDYIDVQLEGETSEEVVIVDPLAVTIVELPKSPFSGDQRITAGVNQTVDKVEFTIKGLKNAKIVGIKKDDYHYYFIWQTREFPNGFYEFTIVAFQGTDQVSLSDKVEIKNNIEEKTETEKTETEKTETEKTETEKTAEITEAEQTMKQEIQSDQDINKSYESELTTSDVSSLELTPKTKLGEWADLTKEPKMEKEYTGEILAECQEKGYLTAEACYIFLSLPQECRENNLSSEKECQRYLQLTQECWEARIFDQGECKKYMYYQGMPEECRQAEATSQEECSNIIMLNSMPAECQAAGVITIEECYSLLKQKEYVLPEYTEAKVEHFDKEDKVIKKIYLPKECQELGIDDEKQCEYYLEQKYVPKECQQAGAETRDECDQIMFKKHGLKECFLAGIEDEQECRSFVFNKYVPQIVCQGMDAWPCKNFIKERYLGDIVAKQIKFRELKERVKEEMGKTLKTEELAVAFEKVKEMISIEERGVNIKILAAEQEIVLDENNNLVQTAPVILVIDSDGDGLPDDIERRLGTNPQEADTDGDGYNDREEVQKNFNPAGEGQLAKTIAPIEQAIIENKILGQPKTEGEIVEEFVIKAITNIAETDIATSAGYVFAGQAEPNRVITLYIYSDLPLVATVQVGEYGNWLYEFKQSLIEGKHEIYIALNDNTGKVIKKSNPFHFFVKEAKAVSVKDFVSSATVETSKKSESLINFYLVIASLVIVVGILLFIIFFLLYKNHQPTKF